MMGKHRVSDHDDPRLNWATLSQAERDAAYDNNGAVANSPALIEERNRLSAEKRARPGAKLDLAYGPTERTRIDLYPAADPAAPCLVFIHGGYWQRNSREVFAMVAEGPNAVGWSVAVPSHTLAPDASLSEIVAEIRACLDWLAAEGPAHGIAGPIILSGWSAGAHLTALALDHPAVEAGLAISGVYELGPIRDTKLNAVLALTPDEVETLSPLRLPVVMKPLTIAYGSAEVPALVQDARLFHAKRAAAHAPGALVPIAGENHFSILAHLCRADGVLVKLARSLADDIPAGRP
ncbi:alpha/beta hydrolase [Xanthobacter sp. KR7-65]|uniref:alpha/beta hydrolase n=1 Tax=Xanthobacter sp. KR7-65 TaxID=3156612 RepID=UPI0032B573BC